VQEFEAAVGGGVLGLDFGDGGFSFGGGASGEVDGAVLGVEDGGEGFAAAGVAACYDEDAAGLIGQVLLSEWWRAYEKTLHEGVHREVERHGGGGLGVGGATVGCYSMAFWMLVDFSVL